MLRKKEFASFDVAAVVRELKEQIASSRVNNVYQLGQRILMFKLHRADHPAYQLILESGTRLHLTTYVMRKPPRPTAFCMALRACLRNSLLTSLEQFEFERVIVFSMKTTKGVFRLVLELFGDGNIILVGEDDKILHALTYKRMRDRNILRGEAFRFAPSSARNPLSTGFKEFSDGLKAFGQVEVVRALARFLGIGGIYSEEVLARSRVERTRNCDSLNAVDVKTIYDNLHGLLSQVTTGILEPCIVRDKDGTSVDVVPVMLKRYEQEGLHLERHASFNEAVDEYYTKLSVLEEALGGADVDKLKKEAERLERMINEQKNLLVEGEKKAELDSRIGDTIYAHIGELQTLFDRLLKAWQTDDLNAVVTRLQAERRDNLTPSLVFRSLDRKGMIVSVELDGLEFSLTLRKTLFENAAEFYEDAKQTKQKMNGARSAMKDACKQLEDVEARMHEAEALKQGKPVEALEELSRRRIKPKKWFEKFRWFNSSDGFLVVAGKDAVTNEILIKRYTSNEDVVFHADIVGAPFVVVKAEAKQPSKQCLSEASEFAAAFSRAWREGYGSVDVYSISPDQLSKGGPSGESVGHGAFVVRGERNWMRGVKLQVAIGIVPSKNGAIQFVGGPVAAVKAKAEIYVTVVPGDSSGKQLLKLVLSTLAIKMPKNMRQEISKVSIEELREYVPFSRGRTMED